jgi:hypothetical protein
MEVLRQPTLQCRSAVFFQQNPRITTAHTRLHFAVTSVVYNVMKHSSSWEASSRSANQNTSHILWIQIVITFL